MQNCKIAAIQRFFPFDCSKENNSYCPHHVKPCGALQLKGLTCAYQIHPTLKQLNKNNRYFKLSYYRRLSKLYLWRKEKKNNKFYK